MGTMFIAASQEVLDHSVVMNESLRNQHSITCTEQRDLSTGTMRQHASSYLGKIQAYCITNFIHSASGLLTTVDIEGYSTMLVHPDIEGYPSISTARCRGISLDIDYAISRDISRHRTCLYIDIDVDLLDVEGYPSISTVRYRGICLDIEQIYIDIVVDLRIS